jgi:pimeloyl-ACP methyl ester carboxylesterase
MKARPIVVALTLLLAACTYHAPHRTRKDGVPMPPITTSQQKLTSDEGHRDAVMQSSIERHPRFTLATVELDDQGQLWSRKQYDQVMADLKGVYGGAPAGVQLVVFVHGWKHSAGVCDSNVACFRELLAGFAEREGDEGRPVYGIYVGWRGRSLKGPVIQEFSFWGRKSTAHRVGSGDAIELFATLEAMHRRKREAERVRTTRMTVIGHSFGAAVVYSAVAGTLKDRLATFAASKSETPGLFVGFGTITLLVNPAFEAMLYDGIDQMIKLNPGMFDSRNPRVLVTVASEADRPTRFAFPAGRLLGTLFQRSRGDGQRSRMITTIGNYEPYATHRLEPARAVASGEERGEECTCGSNIASIFAAEADYDVSAFSADEDVEMFGRTRLRKIAAGPQAVSPFPVIRASSDVIAGHNDIWSPAFAEFMAALILRTDALMLQGR